MPTIELLPTSHEEYFLSKRDCRAQTCYHSIIPQVGFSIQRSSSPPPPPSFTRFFYRRVWTTHLLQPSVAKGRGLEIRFCQKNACLSRTSKQRRLSRRAFCVHANAPPRRSSRNRFFRVKRYLRSAVGRFYGFYGYMHTCRVESGYRVEYQSRILLDRFDRLGY